MKLFFLVIFILVLFIIFIKNISIKISIINLEIDTDNKNIIKDYEFEYGLFVFNKFPIIKYKINENRVKKLKNSKVFKRISNLDFLNSTKGLEKNFLKDYKSIFLNKMFKKSLKQIKPQILKFNLSLNIGIENILVTTFTIPIISTLISFILKKFTINVKSKKNNTPYYYKITPVYNKNIIKLRLNCIINVKVVHIINIIYIFLIKKGRSDKYERTSYRRSYGYSHE